MIANKLTPELVREYHGDLLTFVEARLITPEDLDGKVAEPLLDFLDELEIVNVNEFLETTAVTVPFSFPLGETPPVEREVFIYLPWEPGETKNFSLASQVEVLSHEGQHAVRSSNNIHWLTEYVKSFVFRTQEERIAFQTSLEMCKLLHGKIPPLKRLAGNLTKYFLRPTDEEVLIAGLAAVIPPIEQGCQATEIGKWAAQWFGERV